MNLTSKPILASDLFCGCGGFSSGLLQACADLKRPSELLAVNHWPHAVATHSLNHPDVRHLCENLDNVDPRKVHPGGKLDILLASPECVHFSNARGAAPMSDQSRASAWHVLRWAEALRIENIVVENVREFQTWGPLDKKGRPIKHKRGEVFRAWLHCFEALGYHVDFKVLNAADYGAATSRQRLFIQASKGRRPRWPTKTHGQNEHLFAPAHRPAREIIDWSLEGNSIFGRKTPLADKTLARIMAGLRKFNGCEFVLGQQSCSAPRDLEGPIPTLSTSCAVSLVQPFFVVFRGTSDVRSVDRPLNTLTTTGKHVGLCEPFIVKFHGDHAGRHNGTNRVYSVDEPLKTLDTSNRFGICEPFIVSFKGTDTVKSLDVPLATLTSKERFALAEPFLLKYYGNSSVADLDEPLDTLTTVDRFGLAQPEPVAVFERDGEIYALMDIRFRMLEPHECAAAMGMGDYQFPQVVKKTKRREWLAPMTKKDRMKMIGNAVSVECARALCHAVLQ